MKRTGNNAQRKMATEEKKILRRGPALNLDQCVEGITPNSVLGCLCGDGVYANNIKAHFETCRMVKTEDEINAVTARKRAKRAATSLKPGRMFKTKLQQHVAGWKRRNPEPSVPLERVPPAVLDRNNCMVKLSHIFAKTGELELPSVALFLMPTGDGWYTRTRLGCLNFMQELMLGIRKIPNMPRIWPSYGMEITKWLVKDKKKIKQMLHPDQNTIIFDCIIEAGMLVNFSPECVRKALEALFQSMCFDEWDLIYNKTNIYVLHLTDRQRLEGSQTPFYVDSLKREAYNAKAKLHLEWEVKLSAVAKIKRRKLLAETQLDAAMDAESTFSDADMSRMSQMSWAHMRGDEGQAPDSGTMPVGGNVFDVVRRPTTVTENVSDGDGDDIPYRKRYASTGRPPASKAPRHPEHDDSDPDVLEDSTESEEESIIGKRATKKAGTKTTGLYETEDIDEDTVPLGQPSLSPGDGGESYNSEFSEGSST